MSTPIRLRIPASPAWIVLARTTATACCARLDFGVDRLEDVRLAVDEVVGMLVAQATPDSEIACEFTPYDDGRLDIAITASTTARTLPPTDSLGWVILTSLVNDVTASVDASTTTIVLRTSREATTAIET